jgi:hypothetical protein
MHSYPLHQSVTVESRSEEEPSEYEDPSSTMRAHPRELRIVAQCNSTRASRGRSGMTTSVLMCPEGDRIGPQQRRGQLPGGVADGATHAELRAIETAAHSWLAA